MLRSALTPSCLDDVTQNSEVMTRYPQPPETQLQWWGLASIPCCNSGGNQHQDNGNCSLAFPAVGAAGWAWQVMGTAEVAAWVLAGQGEKSKATRVFCLEDHQH